ncbi:relaxase/mobilization nuclease domain-containing protein [Aurantimonas sp. VKM B-3413]|uniref:relaxase/mobilization nuclease domain-containing protein n=1 Tax=Aurantimonas sp. VKM B-3413 TaxID=2779401 RepID=UPI001E2998CA|nr:relaxase/mobilization nuclease domain-containing protein [Aurantimonas sp. VKM B-3413]MCB8838079.1 relaxase/mobilization nuclease domain-containing protein [Aurantimonas sp. VKM B-3413]
MILKASQRGGGQDLARHLMRVDDNEHVRVHELRGFASDDLKGAFKEAEAIARGTRCRQYLFSLSLSPPEGAVVTEAQFEAAISQVEDKLGLQGQPRAVVFHEKEGRRHAHCVWSRIDAGTMTARQMSFFKTKLQAVSRGLYLDHGWEVPRGLLDRAARDPAGFTLAEWQQAKRLGVDPRWQKLIVQECWKDSASLKDFETALEAKGFFLARGDRRGHVVVDHDGTVHALARMLDLKAKDIRARLGDEADLRSVDQTKARIGERMTPAIRRHVAEGKARFAQSARMLDEEKAAMTLRHRAARGRLDLAHRAEWESAVRDCADRMPRGISAIWQRLSGQYAETRRRNETAMASLWQHQTNARQDLIEKQLAQRAALQERIRDLRRDQASQLRTLREEIGRFLAFTRGQHGPSRDQTRAPDRAAARQRSLGLRLER